MKQLFITFVVLVSISGVVATQVRPTTASRTLEDEIEDVLNKQRELALKKNIPAMRAILADDYLSTNAYGDIRDKEETLRSYERDKLVYQALELTEMRILVLSPTAAVANFLVTTREFNSEKNRDDSGYFRVTRVLAKRKGHWQVVVNHSTSTMP